MYRKDPDREICSTGRHSQTVAHIYDFAHCNNKKFYKELTQTIGLHRSKRYIFLDGQISKLFTRHRNRILLI